MTRRHLRVRSMVLGAAAGSLLIAPITVRLFTGHTASTAAAVQASPSASPAPVPLPLPGGSGTPSPSPGGYQTH